MAAVGRVGVAGAVSTGGCGRQQLSSAGQLREMSTVHVQRVEVMPWWFWLVVGALVLKVLSE